MQRHFIIRSSSDNTKLLPPKQFDRPAKVIFVSSVLTAMRFQIFFCVLLSLTIDRLARSYRIFQSKFRKYTNCLLFPIDCHNLDYLSNINEFSSFPSIVITKADAISEIDSSSYPSHTGVTYYDAVVGSGDDYVKEGNTVQFLWVLRRSNGYFVDASSNYDNDPFIYKVGNTNKVIRGIDEGIRGMKVGGVRRINIPPSLGYTEGVGDGKPGPMPAGFGPRRQIEVRKDKEVWYFELKLLKLKQ